MLAYNVTADAIYIDDPNYPGDEARFIPITKDSTGRIKFGMYETYDEVGFFGLDAMMNEPKTRALWDEVISGRPSMGVSSADYFPQDVIFQVAVGKDGAGNYITQPLTSGLTITKDNAATLTASDGGNFVCRITNADSSDKVLLMTQMAMYGEVGSGFTAFTLPEGTTRIGMLHQKNNGYVNFHWFDVIIQGGGAVNSDGQPPGPIGVVDSDGQPFSPQGDAQQVLGAYLNAWQQYDSDTMISLSDSYAKSELKSELPFIMPSPIQGFKIMSITKTGEEFYEAHVNMVALNDATKPVEIGYTITIAYSDVTWYVISAICDPKGVSVFDVHGTTLVSDATQTPIQTPVQIPMQDRIVGTWKMTDMVVNTHLTLSGADLAAAQAEADGYGDPPYKDQDGKAFDVCMTFNGDGTGLSYSLYAGGSKKFESPFWWRVDENSDIIVCFSGLPDTTVWSDAEKAALQKFIEGDYSVVGSPGEMDTYVLDAGALYGLGPGSSSHTGPKYGKAK